MLREKYEVSGLECCLKDADDDSPGGGLRPPPPPGGSLHTLASEKFEFRVIVLERYFLDFLEICSKPTILFCAFSNRIATMTIELLALLLSPYASETLPILQISQKASNLWYRDLCTTKSDPISLVVAFPICCLAPESCPRENQVCRNSESHTR